MKQAKFTFILCILALFSACNSPVASQDPNLSDPSQGTKAKEYGFPDEIDPDNRYLFYLHGKIIEDQGLPAISPDYGEYRYQEILDAFEGYGFRVISETRPKDTDSFIYAQKIAGQVRILLDAGVPAENISVIGASKGAGIALLASNLLAEQDINYVLLAICHPDVVQSLIQEHTYLHGRILSIYDGVDENAGSCAELFTFSAGLGLADYDEIVLDIGTGHGILYEPMDEWVLPAVKWAQGDLVQ